MDYQNSNSCFKDSLYSEQGNRSSENFEGFSRLVMNESESLLTSPEEIDDSIELYANGGPGDISMSSEIFSHIESGSKTLLLCENENNASNSIVNTLNENAAFNSPGDLDFILSQHYLPRTTDCPFSIVPGVPDNKDIEIDNDQTLFTGFGLEYQPENVMELDNVRQNINACNENSFCNLQLQNEVQSFSTFESDLSRDYGAEYNTSVQASLLEDSACVPASLEDSYKIIYDTNIPATLDKTGMCGFSSGQRDDGGQFISRNPNKSPNQMSPLEVSQVCDESRCELRGNVQLIASDYNTAAVAAPPEKQRFDCDMCKRSYAHKRNLNVHLRSHSKKMLFNCDVCGKGFFRIDHLTAHARIHTGEKPFVCDYCGKISLTTVHCPLIRKFIRKSVIPATYAGKNSPGKVL